MNVFTPKTPDEAFYLTFDFKHDLGSASISSAAVKVYPLVDNVKGDEVTTDMITAARQNVDGSIVYFWIKAGQSGNLYLIECEITASDESVYEGQGVMQVQDVKQ